ncbi:hypothetical protein ABT160_24160 [Streptomyces sp. NPDC001941]|uniref:hypothetical protein n=1 Tax=Streptomyces sp. NPDC001941 TaxID=3154659 RepID=UPI00331C8646
MLLEDGTEPGPALFASSDGPSVHRSYRWQDHDGRFGNPQAAALRGACSCGWRGENRYPLAWSTEDGEAWVENAPSSDCQRDWSAHLEQVEAASVQVPDKLEKRAEKLVRRLEELSVDEPLAVLKVLDRLERQLKEVRQDTAYQVLCEQKDQEEGRSWEEIAAALALPVDEVQSRLLRYQREV